MSAPPIVEAEPNTKIDSANTGKGVAAIRSCNSFSCPFGRVEVLAHGSCIREQAPRYFFGNSIMNSNHNDGASEDRTLLILFATETGTAQDVADRIARECRRIHFKCRVSSMDVYPLVNLPHVLPDWFFELLYSPNSFRKI